MSPSSPVRRSAFTLIELLVVISIIALLIAVLLPALTNARAVARTAVCAANQRQVAIGGASYADDFKGRLPGGGYHQHDNFVGPGNRGNVMYLPANTCTSRSNRPSRRRGRRCRRWRASPTASPTATT